MYFISVMVKRNFLAAITFSICDLSEIIPICWFSAQEIFCIINIIYTVKNKDA